MPIMKKIVILAAGVIAMMASCTSKNANSNAAAEAADSVAADATGLAQYPVDEEGYYVIFNGKDLNGWRGYGRDTIPSRWTVEDGAIKFTCRRRRRGSACRRRRHYLWRKAQELRARARVEGFKRRQLGYILPCPGGLFRERGWHQDSRADLYLCS